MLDVDRVLPEDHEIATLVGRVYDPAVGGPSVVAVDGDRLIDLTDIAPTVSVLLERPDAVSIVRARRTAATEFTLRELLDNVGAEQRVERAHLLSPIDIQVVKAAGVTFVRSMVERVIEERAAGDNSRAEELRRRLADVLEGQLRDVAPGSEAAAEAKRVLIEEGLWSPYLEVGLGQDAEIFTKAPVLSTVGSGQAIGVLRESTWNNPEPELVYVARSTGEAVGVTLGNDVNLRDIEGRSALLLGKAKDNNASCSIGPFVRLFDDEFTPGDARELNLELRVEGSDGFLLEGRSSMREISRLPEELLAQTRGPHHDYPDGFVLMTGTHFAPTEDRDVPGAGFTHHVGDVVRISSPRLGELANVVGYSDEVPRWRTGIWELMVGLAERGCLPPGPAEAPPSTGTSNTRN